MKNWLEKPYPLLGKNRDKFLLALGFALFTYLFLLLYQPFGAATIPNKSLFLLGFGLSVFVALAFNYLLLPRLLKSGFDPDKWQVKKEILYISWSFCLIALLNYIYNSTVGKNIAPQYGLLAFLGITFSVGVFPLLGLLFFTERYLNKKNRALARQLAGQKASAIPDSRSFIIEADTLKSEPLQLRLDDFLFATSDSNYTTFFYTKEGKLEKQLMRCSLKSVEEQLAGFDSIVRCRRLRHLRPVPGSKPGRRTKYAGREL